MKRLFFALWPDRATRKQLQAIGQQITEPGVRIVKPANLHVTLSFLGNVTATDEKRLRDFCDDIDSESFSLTFDRMTCWPKPRILCLLAEPVAGVLDLLDQINARVEMAGIALETRPYRPHITLARKVMNNLSVPFEKVTWSAQDFCLVESVSDENGVEYHVLHRWPLKSPET